MPTAEHLAAAPPLRLKMTGGFEVALREVASWESGGPRCLAFLVGL
jgi:hypothetical protein